MGRQNPPGFWVRVCWVQVWVTVVSPCENPYPRHGWLGYPCDHVTSCDIQSLATSPPRKRAFLLVFECWVSIWLPTPHLSYHKAGEMRENGCASPKSPTWYVFTNFKHSIHLLMLLFCLQVCFLLWGGVLPPHVDFEVFDMVRRGNPSCHVENIKSDVTRWDFPPRHVDFDIFDMWGWRNLLAMSFSTFSMCWGGETLLATSISTF